MTVRRDTLENNNVWTTASPNMKNGKSLRSTTVSVTTKKFSKSTAGKNNCEKNSKKTSWKSIYLLTAICMFCGVQFSIYFPTLWPFLKTVDPKTSEMFFGIITASYSVGQEAFKQDERRWVMVASRFFVGLGAGTVSVMRAYAATSSTLKDRARAITLIQAAYVIGMTIGPAIPVAFSPIGYPGWLLGPLHVDMYTSSAWFACFVCIASLILLLILLEEKYAGIQNEDEADYNPLPNFHALPVFICVMTQFTLMFIITNLETVGAMYAMAIWSWTSHQTVVVIGIIQALNGIFSIFLYASFALKFGDCMSKGRERICTMFWSRTSPNLPHCHFSVSNWANADIDN
ncbi:hypothetical protein KIN20_030275 [Parelaphostrongylus tenuis]|uniref:Major facilitator superfamily (MFS) profile domain-containing protein n=1 Tax=Parelaphostrongylus tenuis TaxID=148309 RepID=A0AAD5WGC3_PARTN|nr:hypothetical protein KIN20_030275 [Parelaphostrongylus tenuis]